jgi:homoserine dehydrogenase
MSHTTFEASFTTSGTSPGIPARGESRPRTLLVGLGPVGRAVLQDAARSDLDLVAVADSSGVLYSSSGIAAARVVAHKQRGGKLRELGAEPLPLELALGLIAPELVLVATDSDPRGAATARAFVLTALAEGARVALATKNALGAPDPRLDRALAAGQLGCDAALGGTGAALSRDLSRLRAECVELELVANATSTHVLDAFARGRDLASALDEARVLGLLEGDPSADLDGTDAALKLAVASALVYGRGLDCAELARPDLRALDARLVWRASQAGCSTRLVARATRSGAAGLEFRELAAGDPLAALPGSVVYAYRLRDGRRVVHVGRALGAVRTARALLRDGLRLVASGGAA